MLVYPFVWCVLGIDKSLVGLMQKGPGLPRLTWEIELYGPSIRPKGNHHTTQKILIGSITKLIFFSISIMYVEWHNMYQVLLDPVCFLEEAGDRIIWEQYQTAAISNMLITYTMQSPHF